LRGEIERRPRHREAMGRTWQVLTCGTSWRVRKNPSMKIVRANAWTRRMHSSPNPPPHAAMAYGAARTRAGDFSSVICPACRKVSCTYAVGTHNLCRFTHTTALGHIDIYIYIKAVDVYNMSGTKHAF
jgi:hypothetical protein